MSHSTSLLTTVVLSGTSWGMSLRAFDDKPGTVVRDVTQGGAAAQAGTQADDLVFQVRSLLAS